MNVSTTLFGKSLSLVYFAVLMRSSRGMACFSAAISGIDSVAGCQTSPIVPAAKEVRRRSWYLDQSTHCTSTSPPGCSFCQAGTTVPFAYFTSGSPPSWNHQTTLPGFGAVVFAAAAGAVVGVAAGA